jgi:hypothetical protein
MSVRVSPSQFPFRDSEFNVCFNSNVALLISYVLLFPYVSLLLSVLSSFAVALLMSVSSVHRRAW